MSLSPRAIAMQGIGYSPWLIAVQGLGCEEIAPSGRIVRGRRRRIPAVEQTEDVAAGPPIIDAPIMSLAPDANHLVVATVSKAKRLRKTAEEKRRLAIHLADEVAIRRLMTQIQDEEALDALMFDWF